MELMTRKESAEYLRIGITKIASLISEGRLPYRQDKPGGKMFFDKRDLDAYDESRKMPKKIEPLHGGTFRKRRGFN